MAIRSERQSTFTLGLRSNVPLAIAVAGATGDVAVVNLTPVSATGPGNGLLVSSDVAAAPVASNVNYAPGTVDPNVAMAPIGQRRQASTAII